MNVFILATKGCNHRPLLEEFLKKLNVSYEVRFVDEHPELVKKYQAHSSPYLIVDGEAVFRGDGGQPLPTVKELEAIFSS